MNMVKRVRLFDMNGVIRDDFIAVLNTTNDILRKYGKPPLTMSQYREMARPDYWAIYAGLGFPETERANAERLFRDIFDSKYAGMARMFPDALRTIQGLKEKGNTIGIVSNLTRRTLDLHTQEYGLNGLLAVTISREDAGELKPSPKSLLIAFQKLGIPPEQGSYVGDQTWDISAARNAGTSPIAISRFGSYHSRRMLESAKPDKIIRRLSSLLYLDAR